MCTCNGCGGRWGGCTVSLIAKILVIIGGLNWGLVGLGMLINSMSDWNVVYMILGSMPSIEAVVYILVGVAALVQIFGCRCKKCMTTCSCGGGSAESKM